MVEKSKPTSVRLIEERLPFAHPNRLGQSEDILHPRNYRAANRLKRELNRRHTKGGSNKVVYAVRRIKED